MKTRSQRYSEKVYEQISALNLDKKEEKTYGSLCHQFPIMVLRSGLSQAVAFVLVKSKLHEGDEKKHSRPHCEFLNNLAELTALELSTNGIERAQQFQKTISSLNLHDYQRVTRQVLVASIWYKRFAESLLGVSQGEEGESS